MDIAGSAVAAGEARRDVRRRTIVRHTDSYRYARALLVIMLATAVDIRNYLDRSSRGGPTRYLILLIPIAALIAIRANGSTLMRKPAPHEWVLATLFVFGLIGTTYGVVIVGIDSTARALFLPMIVAVLAVFVVEPLTGEEARRLLKAIAVIGTIYIVLGAIAYSGVIHSLLAYRQFKNATFPYVAIGIAATVLLRRPWWTLALAAGALVIWRGYPSATASLILLTMVIVFLATARGASRLRPYVLGGTILLALAIAVVNFSASTQVAQDYFNSVGKRNTSQGRLEFWASGIATFEESPWIGNAFASDTVVESGRDHASPYHNDYIMFLAEGGLLGAGLLVAWIILLLVDLTRRYFGFVRARAPDHANLARLLLVGLSGFFVSMASNPVLEGLSRSATIFALAAIAGTLGQPDPPVAQAEADDDDVTATRAPVSAATPAGARSPVR
jgi:O-antigen ligase